MPMACRMVTRLMVTRLMVTRLMVTRLMGGSTGTTWKAWTHIATICFMTSRLVPVAAAVVVAEEAQGSRCRIHPSCSSFQSG